MLTAHNWVDGLPALRVGFPHLEVLPECHGHWRGVPTPRPPVPTCSLEILTGLYVTAAARNAWRRRRLLSAGRLLPTP